MHTTGAVCVANDSIEYREQQSPHTRVWLTKTKKRVGNSLANLAVTGKQQTQQNTGGFTAGGHDSMKTSERRRACTGQWSSWGKTKKIGKERQKSLTGLRSWGRIQRKGRPVPQLANSVVTVQIYGEKQTPDCRVWCVAVVAHDL